MPTRPSDVSTSTMARSAQGSWMPAALSKGPSRNATGVMRMWVMRTSRFIMGVSIGRSAGLLHQRRPARDFLVHQGGQFLGAAAHQFHSHLLSELGLHVRLLERLLDLLGQPLHDGPRRAL